MEKRPDWEQLDENWDLEVQCQGTSFLWHSPAKSGIFAHSGYKIYLPKNGHAYCSYEEEEVYLVQQPVFYWDRGNHVAEWERDENNFNLHLLLNQVLKSFTVKKILGAGVRVFYLGGGKGCALSMNLLLFHQSKL